MISIDFKLTISDFRKATYYAEAKRYATAIKIAIFVVFTGLGYLIGGLFKLWEIGPLVVFIGAAYLLWVLILMGATEKRIKTFIGSKDSLLGCNYHFELDEEELRFSIKEKNIKNKCKVKNLFCVFELKHLLLFYLSEANVLIVPKKNLADEQVVKARQYFRDQIPEKFFTRFK